MLASGSASVDELSKGKNAPICSVKGTLDPTHLLLLHAAWIQVQQILHRNEKYCNTPPSCTGIFPRIQGAQVAFSMDSLFGKPWDSSVFGSSLCVTSSRLLEGILSS